MLGGIDNVWWVVTRTLVAADMILDRPPSDACVSAMHASGDQWTATVPTSPSTPDLPQQTTSTHDWTEHATCVS